MNNTSATHNGTIVAEKSNASAAAVLAQPFMKMFESGLNDIYKGEKHLVRVLPVLAKAAFSPELKNAFENHLEETKGQVNRLENIFSSCKIQSGDGNSSALEGLTACGDAAIKEYPQGNLRDAALIMAAEKVEHFEIAAYTSLYAMAEILQCKDALPEIQETLDEEVNANKMLMRIAKAINQLATKESPGSKDGHLETSPMKSK